MSNLLEYNLKNEYLLLLKYFNNNINYKNIELLQYFINLSGNIISNKLIKISYKKYHLIVKSIKKARVLKLLPFIITIKDIE